VAALALGSRRACTSRSSARATSRADSPAATALVQRTMGDAIAATASSPRKSPKTLLQEWRSGHHPLPLYRTLDVSGPEHRRGFVVEVEVAGNVAQGAGASKRAAEEAAAAKLMELVTQ